MNISDIAKKRYSTKSFDASRKISRLDMEQIETLLQYSPSSTNSQPWHFFIASTEAGKEKIANSTKGFYIFNEDKVLDASHVVVFCTRATMGEDHLGKILEKEDADGRFANEEARNGMHGGRSYFVNMHRFELRDAQHWMEKQVYLALGTLLLGAGTLDIDACPIEGFDQTILDEELGLRDLGFTSSVIVPLGYHKEDDFNASLPKSRLPLESILTRL